MAGSARWELHYPPDAGDEIELRDALMHAKARASTPSAVAVIRKWITQEAPAAETEIRVNYTNLFDGTTTPAVVNIDSSDNAQDKAAGTGGLTAGLLINDADDEPAVQAYTLNGTTHATHATKVKRVNDLRVDSWGTDGKATGTVQAVNAADTELYARCAAGDNFSINARYYVPSGWKAIVAKARANYTIVAAAAGLVATAGVNGRWLFNDGGGGAGNDLNKESRFSLTGYGTWEDITPAMRVITGAAGAYISLTHQALDTDLATHWATFEYSIVMWKEA